MPTLEKSHREGDVRPKQTYNPQEAVSDQTQVMAIIAIAKEGGDTVPLVETVHKAQNLVHSTS